MKFSPPARDCAAQLIEIVPAVMRTIRAQMRSSTSTELTVVQFRTLGFLDRRRGASLSFLAEHIGLSLPTVSKLVQKLVKRGYLKREFAESDRRRSVLTPTAKGQRILMAARKDTREHLADRLSQLRPNERTSIINAAQALRPIFLADVTQHLASSNGHPTASK